MLLESNAKRLNIVVLQAMHSGMDRGDEPMILTFSFSLELTACQSEGQLEGCSQHIQTVTIEMQAHRPTEKWRLQAFRNGDSRS